MNTSIPAITHFSKTRDHCFVTFYPTNSRQWIKSTLAESFSTQEFPGSTDSTVFCDIFSLVTWMARSAQRFHLKHSLYSEQMEIKTTYSRVFSTFLYSGHTGDTAQLNRYLIVLWPIFVSYTSNQF